MSEKYNIAIIDDENEILSVLERFLTREKGHIVRTYNNPLNALSSIQRDTQLVLLDVMMPQMNGLDLLPKLKEKHPHLKVLIMTAYSTLDKVLDAHRYGANDYVMKPFESLEALNKKITHLMQK